LFVIMHLGVIISAQAPYGNYLPLAPGQYVINADSSRPAGASAFPKFLATDTFTIEFYYKLNAASQNVSSLVGVGPAVYIQEFGGYRILCSYSGSFQNVVCNFDFDSPSIYEWTHVVMEFIPWAGNTHRCFVASNGIFNGWADMDNSLFSNMFTANKDMYLGGGYSNLFTVPYNLNCFNGLIDEFRVSNTSRYHLDIGTPYTVPTSEFISDAQTKCLLHFNGSPTDTVVQDASLNNRDFRIRRYNFIQDTIGAYTTKGFVDADTICYGDQVFSQGGDVYSWSPSFGLSNSSIANPMFYLNDTTITYYVTITNTPLSYTTTDTITLTTLPVVSLGPDITACTGTNSVLLSVPGIFSDVYWLSDYSTNLTFSTDTAGLFGVIVNISAGCFSSDEIQVDFMNDYYIEGTAFKSDSTTMPFTYVYFINADTDNVVLNLDSVLTDASGNFSKTVLFDPFYILLAPDSVSYPDQLPVYYDTSLYIQNAVHISILCDTLNTNIYAQAGVNPGGPCIAGGTVVYNGRAVNGDPVIHLKIILINSAGDPVDYTFTNDTGYFVFNNLPTGDIKFYVDYMGVNNLIAPHVNLTTMQDFSNLPFELFPDRLLLLGVPNVGIENINESIPFSVYPNPSTEKITVVMENIVGNNFRILDLCGRAKVFSTINDNRQIDISSFPAGMYCLEINTPNGIRSARFIKQ
jgi:hypothetical protein